MYDKLGVSANMFMPLDCTTEPLLAPQPTAIDQFVGSLPPPPIPADQILTRFRSKVLHDKEHFGLGSINTVSQEFLRGASAPSETNNAGNRPINQTDFVHEIKATHTLSTCITPKGFPHFVFHGLPVTAQAAVVTNQMPQNR